MEYGWPINEMLHSKSTNYCHFCFTRVLPCSCSKHSEVSQRVTLGRQDFQQRKPLSFFVTGLSYSYRVLHCEAEKRNQFSLACIFLVLDRNWWFFSHKIRPKKSRSISYNSVYLILACVENFATTVTLNILCLLVK